MKHEMELKLQALADGELTDSEARELHRQITGEAGALALLGELRATRAYLRGNEPEARLTDSREFYWSKIQRDLERGAVLETTGFSPSLDWLLAALRRRLVPLAGFAVVFFLAFGAIRYYDISPFGPAINPVAEVQNESEHMGSFSFRSHSENMFVVWVYNKADELSTEDEAEASEDDVILQ
jgi:hypothetical protein